MSFVNVVVVVLLLILINIMIIDIVVVEVIIIMAIAFTPLRILFSISGDRLILESSIAAGPLLHITT